MMQITKVWWDGEKLMAEPIDPAAIYKEPEQEPMALVTKNEALKREVEALKFAHNAGYGGILREMKITPFTIKREEALAQPQEANNFCPRCGKRTPDLAAIHTCTPPKENNT